MDHLKSLLPQHQGMLPYFLIYAGLSAMIHSVVCYRVKASTALTAFSGPKAPPAHPLMAHTYGVKNIYTGLIRLYAAYNIANPQVYDLAIWTFAGVLFLYVTETYIYETSRLREATWPFVTAGSGLIWMVNQRSWYLEL